VGYGVECCGCGCGDGSGAVKPGVDEESYLDGNWKGKQARGTFGTTKQVDGKGMMGFNGTSHWRYPLARVFCILIDSSSSSRSSA
jgi:hypothetical protein